MAMHNEYWSLCRRQSLRSQYLARDIEYYTLQIGSSPIVRDYIWLHGSGEQKRRQLMLTTNLYSAMYNRLQAPGWSLRLIMPLHLQDNLWCEFRMAECRMEAFLINELLPKLHIDRDTDNIHAVRPELHGYSMGGYGALRLAIKHSRMFSRVITVGAGPLADDLYSSEKGDSSIKEQIMRSGYLNNPELFRRNSPYQIASQYLDSLIGSGLKIRLIVGRNDPAYQANSLVARRLSMLGVSVDLITLEATSHPYVEYLHHLMKNEQLLGLDY